MSPHPFPSNRGGERSAILCLLVQHLVLPAQVLLPVRVQMRVLLQGPVQVPLPERVQMQVLLQGPARVPLPVPKQLQVRVPGYSMEQQGPFYILVH